ncbi:hypothetical protein GF314_06675, partial [bacterium]|nr:hypothetical protein [bacterium]
MNGFVVSTRSSAMFAVAMVLSLGATAIAERTPVPAPPPGRDGISLFPADQRNVLDLDRPEPPRTRLENPVPPGGERLRGQVGGDDVEIWCYEYTYDRDVAISSYGWLYMVAQWCPDDSHETWLTVRRSNDDGTTWHHWASLVPGPGERYHDPVIHIAQGTEDRLFLAHCYDPGAGEPTEVRVAWSPVMGPEGDLSNVSVIDTAAFPHSLAFTSDANMFSAYYTYLVYCNDNGDGDD